MVTAAEPATAAGEQNISRSRRDNRLCGLAAALPLDSSEKNIHRPCHRGICLRLIGVIGSATLSWHRAIPHNSAGAPAIQHLIVPQFMARRHWREINADYPKISTSGSFPVDQVSFGSAFRTLLEELNSDEFREAFEEKFAD